MSNLSELLIKTYTERQQSTFSGLITSVGDGGNNFSVMFDTEARNIKNGSPYGFVSSPPPSTYGYVITGTGDEDDVLIGVLDKDRPKGIVTGGGSAMYSIGKGFIICNADGSIDIITPEGKTAKYNGVELGTSESGITENRVIELIKRDAVTLAEDGNHQLDDLLSERGLSQEAIELLIDGKFDEFEQYMITTGDQRYVKLLEFDVKMAILQGLVGDINFVVSGQRITDEYGEGTLEQFVHNTSISEAHINQMLYGTGEDIPDVFSGEYTPTMETLPTTEWEVDDYPAHKNSLFLVKGTGENAGYYYIFDQDDEGNWLWRRARQDELGGAITGLDETIRTELTTNYWNAERTETEIDIAKGVIHLEVETLRDDTETQFATVTSGLGEVQTDLIFHTEALSRHQSSIDVLEDQIQLKASQEDMTRVQSALGDMEETVSTHTAQLEVLPEQISSTVKTSIEEIKVGSRNLIINSQSMVYEDYYFDNTIGSSLFGVMTLGVDTFNS